MADLLFESLWPEELDAGVETPPQGLPLTLKYPDLASNLATLGNGCTVDEVDFMILSVVGRDDGTTVDFNSVELDGSSLGDFSGTGGWFN